MCVDKLSGDEYDFFCFSECSLGGRLIKTKEWKKKPAHANARETPKVSRGQWIYTARRTGFAFRLLERRRLRWWLPRGRPEKKRRPLLPAFVPNGRRRVYLYAAESLLVFLRYSRVRIHPYVFAYIKLLLSRCPEPTHTHTPDVRIRLINCLSDNARADDGEEEERTVSVIVRGTARRWLIALAMTSRHKPFPRRVESLWFTPVHTRGRRDGHSQGRDPESRHQSTVVINDLPSSHIIGQKPVSVIILALFFSYFYLVVQRTKIVPVGLSKFRSARP